MMHMKICKYCITTVTDEFSCGKKKSTKGTGVGTVMLHYFFLKEEISKVRRKKSAKMMNITLCGSSSALIPNSIKFWKRN